MDTVLQISNLVFDVLNYFSFLLESYLDTISIYREQLKKNFFFISMIIYSKIPWMQFHRVSRKILLILNIIFSVNEVIKVNN